MRVRHAAREDVPAITELVNLAYEVERFFVDEPRTTDAEIGTCLDRGDFLLLEDGGSIVGAVEVTLEGKRGHFGMLSVSPSSQSRGHGARLVAEAESYLRARGARTVEISVVSQREPLLPWYRRLGYRAVGTEPYVAERPTKIPVHFVVMQKELALVGAVEV